MYKYDDITYHSQSIISYDLQIHWFSERNMLQRLIRQNVSHFFIVLWIGIDVSGKLMHSNFFVGTSLFGGIINFVLDSYFERLKLTNLSDIIKSIPTNGKKTVNAIYLKKK